LLRDGRVRLEQEVADLESRAEAEVAAAAGRTGDEMRTEIGRIVADTTDGVVAATLDPVADQELIEAFIQRVGAS
jgi:F-type H+-transporting ATPase subunit b